MLTAKKIKAQYAVIAITENVASDSSKARPVTKIAADNLGSCHINTSPTATVHQQPAKCSHHVFTVA